MALTQRYVPPGQSQRGRSGAANTDYAPLVASPRRTRRIAEQPRFRPGMYALLLAHLCLGIAAPYLLLTGFTVLGTWFAALLVSMLLADAFMAFQRRRLTSPRGSVLSAWSRRQFPLRAITVLSCIGVISGTMLGVAMQEQPALAAKASTSLDGKFALLSDSVNGLAFSPDGTSLALETPTGIAIMNRATNAMMRQFSIPTPGFVAGRGRITLAWNAHLLAATYRVTSPDGEITYAVTAWRVATGAVQFTAALDGAVSGLAWSPDGATLGGYLPPQTAGGFGVILQWDVATGAGKTPIFITNAPAAAQGDAPFAWSPDPTRMAVINDSDTVLIVDLRYTNSSERFTDTQAITALSWSPDGMILASGHSDGSVSLFDTRTLTVTHTIVTQPRAVLSMAWSPDSGRLLVAHGANLAIIDVATARPLLALNRPANQHVTTTADMEQPGFQSYTLAGASTQREAAVTIASAVWSADGAVISARYSDGALVSWDANALGG